MTDPIFLGEKAELVEDFLEWEDSLDYTIGTKTTLSILKELALDNARPILFDTFKICYTNPNGYPGAVYSVLDLSLHFAEFPENRELFVSLDLKHQMNVQKNIHKMDQSCISSYMTVLRIARAQYAESLNLFSEGLSRGYLDVFDLINPDLSDEFYDEIRRFKSAMTVLATRAYAYDTVLCMLTVLYGEKLTLEIMKRLISESSELSENSVTVHMDDVIKLIYSWDQVKEHPMYWALTVVPEITV